MKKYKSISLLFFSLLCCSVAMISCKKNYVYGDIQPNTDRMIVEFENAAEPQNVSMTYATSAVDVEVADLRFLTRSKVKGNATVKVTTDASLVDDYNTENGTSYTALSSASFAFNATDYTLTAEERAKPVTIKLKPVDIANGEYALGLSISDISGAEKSTIANKILIILSVKNKYDGIYSLKGHFTRTDNPALTGRFETEVEMITSGASSVAMYWPEGGGFAQPFSNAGELTAFSNVGPEVYFNGTDQVVDVFNIAGDATGAPLMHVVTGSNSRFDVTGAAPRIYLKYYYNADPTNRIFADTLTYIGER